MTTTRQHARPVLALAGAEAAHLARHPVLWAGVLATVAVATLPYRNGPPAPSPWPTEDYTSVWAPWAFLFTAAYLTAMLAASRPADTGGMLTARPLTADRRTAAVLLAGAVPVALAAATTAAVWTVIARNGGIVTGRSPGLQHLTPGPAEAAAATALVALGHALGVAAARTTRHHALAGAAGVVAGFAGVAMYWLWQYPLSVITLYAPPLTGTDLGAAPTDAALDAYPIISPPGDPVHAPTWEGWIRDTDMLAWHTLYLTGVTALLAAYAITRSGRPPRWLALLGLLTTAAGIYLQTRAHG